MRDFKLRHGNLIFFKCKSNATFHGKVQHGRIMTKMGSLAFSSSSPIELDGIGNLKRKVSDVKKRVEQVQAVQDIDAGAPSSVGCP